jgi:hypothetical protein
MSTPAAALAGAAPLTMREAEQLRLAHPYDCFRLTFGAEALEAAPVVSRHCGSQPSPQEWDCGCVTAVYITDGDALAGERPFEMRLAIACGARAVACSSARCPMSADDVQAIERELEAAREQLATLTATAQRARSASDAATPGGLHGDPATFLGVRRRGGRRGDERHWAAYDREAAAQAAVREQERLVRVLEHRLERARRDAQAPRDLAALARGWFVRDRHGWHRVVRVNAKTVSVETGYSWTDRIPLERIIETRPPQDASG